MQTWRWALAQLTRRLWARAALYGVAGVAAALIAAAGAPYVPDALARPFGGGAVTSLLNVLATSLLSVATFSTAAMLTAYTNVSQGATPRAAALITGDSHAQGALASFIGAFLYAVVAFSALGTGYYANGGRAILFAVTMAVLFWVAVTLLRWLDQLLNIARVGYAVEAVERATSLASQGRFGAAAAARAWADPPADAVPLEAGEVGYVANVDIERLERAADRHGLELWVACAPGAFAHARRALLHLRAARAPPAAATAELRAAFDIQRTRSFDQDPRFGFVVLGEVAAKALSPGVNDPGTAIVVLGAATRLLTEWRRLGRDRAPDGEEGRVRLRPPAYAELVDDVFRPIAAYGASDLSVDLRLQKALAALACDADADAEAAAALEAMARLHLQRARAGLAFAPDRERLERLAAELWAPLGRHESVAGASL